MKECISLAIVGGSRGAYLGPVLSTLAGKARLAAVCDNNEAALRRWQEEHPDVKAYSDYALLLEDPDIDAVFIATPLFLHARQAIAALRAGKHVLSEVIAIHTLEDAWELIETVEQTGLTYMMAENYCYMRANMMVKNMVEQGLFGDIVHVEGGYIHDCRTLFHDANGQLTWRGELVRDYKGNSYPTHSLGPVAQWLGINRAGGGEFDSLTTFVSRSEATANYFAEHVSPDHPGASPGYWKQGDSSVTLIRTKKGAVITLRYDIQSSRPHNMTHYALQGTRGAYLSERYGGEDPLVWLEKPEESKRHSDHASWEPLWNGEAEWEHPLWKRWKSDADQTGHGGGDFFVLREFVSSILERRKPAIDVYDAVSWSAVSPLSMLSVDLQGAAVPFPDFKRGRSSVSG